MAKPPVVEQVQVNFRMPAHLRDRIRAASQEAGRSMNAEIIHALEEKYPMPPNLVSESLSQLALVLSLYPDAPETAFLREYMEEAIDFADLKMSPPEFAQQVSKVFANVASLLEDLAKSNQRKLSTLGANIKPKRNP